MQFAQAVRRAAALPLEDDRLAWLGSGIAARTKNFWTYFYVDQQPTYVPPFTFDAKTLAKTVTEHKVHSVYTTPEGAVALAHGTDDMATTLHAVPLIDAGVYWPGAVLDGFNAEFSAEKAKALLSLAQLADPKDQLRSGIRCVHATGGWFEAGTEAQFGRLWAGGFDGECLIEASALDKFRISGPTQYGFDDKRFYIHSGDEARLIRQVDAWYPDLSGFYEAEEAYEIRFPASAFRDAVKVFRRKEDRRVLRLQASGNQLSLYSVLTHGKAVIDVETDVPYALTLELFVSGEKLTTVAKTWPYDNVWLRCPTTTTQTARLQFHSQDEFVSYLYPLWRYA